MLILGVNMQPYISAVASKVGDPSMGGVGGGIMAKAFPQAWANLINACAHLEKRGTRKGLGEGMGIITHEGAAAMARATQNLANLLWGLLQFKWNEPRLIGVLFGALMERISSSVPQHLANVLVALARLSAWVLSALWQLRWSSLSVSVAASHRRSAMCSGHWQLWGGMSQWCMTSCWRQCRGAM